MAKEVEVKVMVSHLQLDDTIYQKGDILSLPVEKVMSLGNSVAVIIYPPEPEPEEFFAEETPKKTPKTPKGRGK
jgi:hypothetical protein